MSDFEGLGDEHNDSNELNSQLLPPASKGLSKAGMAAMQGVAENEPSHDLSTNKDVDLIEEYNNLFTDYRNRPSFKEISGVPTVEEIQPHVKEYVDRTRKLLNKLEEIRESVEKQDGKYGEQDLYATEDLILNGVLSSSEAPEVRLLSLGLKPAVQSNVGGEYREKLRQTATKIVVEDVYPLALARGARDIRFVTVNYGTPEEPRNYDIAYSPSAIKKVMEANKEVFSGYGYEDDSTETIEKVLKDNNNLLRSLMLGYPMRSAMFHDATYDELIKLPLNAEQRQCIEKIFSSEESRKTVADSQINNNLTFAKGEGNEEYHHIWTESGLAKFLDGVAVKYALIYDTEPEQIRQDWI